MSFDRKTYMRQYLKEYRKRKQAARIAAGGTEYKPAEIAVRYSDDPQAYMKQYYKKNREKLLTDSRIRGKAWRENNKSKKIDKYNRDIIEYKKKAFDILGSVCCRCGFADIRALQVDHVYGCGLPRNERVKRGEHGNRLYRHIVAGRVKLELYQLLCANCNWIKRYENNECGRRS